jgi:hypothetical protein
MSDEVGSWRPFTPEALAGLEVGTPVVVMTTEWRKGKRSYDFREGVLTRYAPSRGIVEVRFEEFDSWPPSGEFCETNVGYYLLLEIERMHEMTGWDA